MLQSRNVTVSGRRTSMRLETEIWDALMELCLREGVTVHSLCTRVDKDRGALGLTAAVRVYVISYFRSAAQGRRQPPPDLALV